MEISSAFVALLVAMVTAKPGYDVNLNDVNSLQEKVDQGAFEIDSLFTEFKQVFNKSYESATEDMRRDIFKFNVKLIQNHNIRYEMGQVTFILGINQFADLTNEEFLMYYTGSVPVRENRNSSAFIPPENVFLPSYVDWRTKNYVTPIKNQGHCGSCWAFSTTGSLEGQIARLTGRLSSLSEQQLVDCSRENHGCNGGIMDIAFEYIVNAGGVMTEQSYPYKAHEGRCVFNRSQAVNGSRVTGHTDIQRGSETALQQAVASVGPVSVAIAVTNSFMLYKSGIYSDPSCGQNLNHGVVAIGYGVTPQDYWLVKNSWGTSWGEKGYIRMARNRGNMCGIATMASFPSNRT